MIIIRPKRVYKDHIKREIIVDGKVIKEGSNLKMLGLLIDFQLTFENHCNQVISKSRRVENKSTFKNR